MNMLWKAASRGPELPAFRRILCALDLAQPTPSALAFAGLLAQHFAAALETLYVSPEGAPPEAELRLQRMLGALQPPVPSGARVVSGAPARAISERAASHGSDLVVLGSRSRSDLGWQFRDDVVRDVSALTDCATLSVHELDRPVAIERILVPVDFGAATSSMVDWASTLALRFGAEVQLLHVVSRERSSPHRGDGAALEALQARMAALGVKVGGQVIVAGSAAGGIESYNDRGEFDLMVMGLTPALDSRRRLTRGVIATLRNRMSVPLLSVRSSPQGVTRPRVRMGSELGFTAPELRMELSGPA